MRMLKVVVWLNERKIIIAFMEFSYVMYDDHYPSCLWKSQQT